jgi:hypothetical protein
MSTLPAQPASVANPPHLRLVPTPPSTSMAPRRRSATCSLPGPGQRLTAPGRHLPPGRGRLRRAAHPAAVHADHLPQRRGLRRARPGSKLERSRSTRCANTIFYPSLAAPTSATCSTSGSSGCPSSPARRTLRPRSASPGTAHQAEADWLSGQLAPKGVGVVWNPSTCARRCAQCKYTTHARSPLHSPGCCARAPHPRRVPRPHPRPVTLTNRRA